MKPRSEAPRARRARAKLAPKRPAPMTTKRKDVDAASMKYLPVPVLPADTRRGSVVPSDRQERKMALPDPPPWGRRSVHEASVVPSRGARVG